MLQHALQCADPWGAADKQDHNMDQPDVHDVHGERVTTYIAAPRTNTVLSTVTFFHAVEVCPETQQQCAACGHKPCHPLVKCQPMALMCIAPSAAHCRCSLIKCFWCDKACMHHLGCAVCTTTAGCSFFADP